MSTQVVRILGTSCKKYTQINSLKQIDWLPNCFDRSQSGWIVVLIVNVFPHHQVKVTQEMKNIHTEQMTRLHLKHQTECDLLEDMRYTQAHTILLSFHAGVMQEAEERKE